MPGGPTNHTVKGREGGSGVPCMAHGVLRSTGAHPGAPSVALLADGCQAGPVGGLLSGSQHRARCRLHCPPSLQPPIPADARTAQSPATPPSRGQPAAAPEREPLGVRSQWAGRQVYTQQKARLRRWRCSAARHSSVGAQREGMRHRDPRTPSRRQARAWSNGLMFNGRMLGRRERGASALSRRMVRPHPPETGPLPDGASR